MLRKFELKNYKNFKDSIVMDFGKVGGYQFSTDCITDNTISKMLIYGRNSTGKTNLGKAIINIGFTLYGYKIMSEGGIFLNADSEEENALFVYTFKFGEDEVIYRYKRLSETELEEETLIINGKEIFSCYYKDKFSMTCNHIYLGIENSTLDRFIETIGSENDNEEYSGQQIPFLRWIIFNIAIKKDSLLLKLADYVKNMFMMTVSGSLGIRTRRTYDRFFECLEDEGELKQFEELLNFMGVECNLVLKKLPDGQNELYFNHNKLVPFYENASSGTVALLNIYRVSYLNASS